MELYKINKYVSILYNFELTIYIVYNILYFYYSSFAVQNVTKI